MTETQKQWFRVTACENIPVREGKAAEIAGHQVAIFNLGGRFLAIENRCPHRGGPLADGIVSAKSIVRPLHAWKFDLTSGVVENHPESQACVATYPMRVEQGIISIELPLLVPEEANPIAWDRPDRPVRWVQRKSPVNSAVPSVTL